MISAIVCYNDKRNDDHHRGKWSITFPSISAKAPILICAYPAHTPPVSALWHPRALGSLQVSPGVSPQRLFSVTRCRRTLLLMCRERHTREAGMPRVPLFSSAAKIRLSLHSHMQLHSTNSTGPVKTLDRSQAKCGKHTHYQNVQKWIPATNLLFLELNRKKFRIAINFGWWLEIRKVRKRKNCRKKHCMHQAINTVLWGPQITEQISKYFTVIISKV